MPHRLAQRAADRLAVLGLIGAAALTILLVGSLWYLLPPVPDATVDPVVELTP